MVDETTFHSEWEQYEDTHVAMLPLYDLVVRPTPCGWFRWSVKTPETGIIVARGRAKDTILAQLAAERTAALLSRH